MRPFYLATIITFNVRGITQRVMGPAHVTPRFRGFFLGYCHLALSQNLAAICTRWKNGWILNEDY